MGNHICRRVKRKEKKEKAVLSKGTVRSGWPEPSHGHASRPRPRAKSAGRSLLPGEAMERKGKQKSGGEGGARKVADRKVNEFRARTSRCGARDCRWKSAEWKEGKGSCAGRPMTRVAPPRSKKRKKRMGGSRESVPSCSQTPVIGLFVQQLPG